MKTNEEYLEEAQQIFCDMWENVVPTSQLENTRDEPDEDVQRKVQQLMLTGQQRGRTPEELAYEVGIALGWAPRKQ